VPQGPSSPDRRRVLLALGFGAANAVALSKLGSSPGVGGARVSNVRDRVPAATGPPTAAVLPDAPPEPPADHVYDVVINGGRVIDPETGYDRLAHVGIDGGTITSISGAALQGRATIDATDRVVSPGFIDMISYAPNDYGIWFKVADGVTTNLGMHGMLVTAEAFFAQYNAQGSPCHFGGAYDNQFMRGQGGLNIGSGKAATAKQIDTLAADIETQLHQGWIGASFSPEYTPGITSEEIQRQAAVAAQLGVPCFFHGRYSTDVPPDDNAKTLAEILDVARTSGAAVHVMHLTSTGGTFQMDQSLAVLQRARDEEHIDVTWCMYPYTFWATYLGSARFADGWQQRFHITYSDLMIPGTGERLNATSFAKHREMNTLAAAFAIPENDVLAGLRSPVTMIGSDAILEPGDNNHPRGAGCFTRALGHYVRDQQTLPLVDALRKMTILPAKRLEARAPALRKKGRLQRGADADITIFDPATVADRATVEDPSQEAAGIDYVLVLGKTVKSPNGLHKNVKPGQPITSVF
jgi:N-acyl-D-aspartate/D-glutamate deacylase